MKNFHAKVIAEIILSRKGIACISSTCYPYSVSTEVAAPTPGTEMTEDQVVGERVRTWLFRRHVMQRELAAHIGVTPGVMSKKIAGKITWSVTDIVCAAAFLGVGIGDLLPDVLVDRRRGENSAPGVVSTSAEPRRARRDSNPQPSDP